MDQACRPQCRLVITIAARAASAVPPSMPGGAAKCVTGSATPQNSNPAPMPPANSMAIQETVENSGRSSSAPSRMRPQGPSASTAAKITKPEQSASHHQLAPTMNHVVKPSTVPAMAWGATTPHSPTGTQIARAIRKTGVICILCGFPSGESDACSSREQEARADADPDALGPAIGVFRPVAHASLEAHLLASDVDETGDDQVHRY